VEAAFTWLAGQGGWGIVVLVLISVVAYQQTRLNKVTDERIADLKTAGTALTAAVTASNAVISANTAVLDKTGANGAQIGEAVRGVEAELERMRQAIERLERRP
jgi:phospholipase/lecithinase/hemolysin